MLAKWIRNSSLAALAGLTVQYSAYYAAGVPLLVGALAEWIMARTPSAYALWLLDRLGVWAKPFAVTGGLAVLGFALLLPAVWIGLTARRRGAAVSGALLLVSAAAAILAWATEYHSLTGIVLFWAPATGVLLFVSLASPDREGAPPALASRRLFLARTGRAALPLVMGAGTLGVALESYWRNERLARGSVSPIDLFPFDPAAERQGFGAGLVRKPVTPVKEFYVMSKNTVDPAISPADWRLRVTLDGDTLRSFTYSELLSLPRSTRYVTLRCVSNTLKSDLMGTAQWTGVRLSQLIDVRRLPSGLVEAALIGVDGHGDSLPLDYAFSEHTLLALGMNGKTLNRDHGFPLRLLAPRYYGFKNVKWIGEIALTSAPYYGTWPKMGYTKEPVIHTMSYIDRVKKQEGKVHLGGVAFAGDRGVRRVQVRADDGEWKDAVLETPLSAYTLTRWVATLDADAAKQVECRAQDGKHQWQANREKPLFPDGVAGPTIKRVWS